MSGAQLLRRNPTVVWRATFDALVASAPDRPDVLTLTGTVAVAAWEALASPITADALLADLAETFGRRPDEVRGDVAALVDTLVLHRLAVVVDGDG